jgi:hypothetical protein
MGNGDCEHGANGCVTVQNIGKDVAVMKSEVETNKEGIELQWKAIDQIKGLLFKAVLSLSILVTVIQVVFKFWKVG